MELENKCLIFGLLVSLLSTVNGRMLELPQALSLPSKHFVLIHGAWHGAWSYFKISAQLKSFGHNVTAIDLAGSGIHPQQAKDFRTITHYHQPLTDFMAASPPDEKVILVGHSFGGLAVCQAMEEFPDKISAAVFVSAAMPGPTLSSTRIYEESKKYSPPPLDTVIAFDDGPNNPPTTITSSPLYLKSYLYQLSPVEDWALATTLVRPFRVFDPAEIEKDLVFTEENYGRVNRVFIITDGDLVSNKEYQLWLVEHNPPNEVMVILGSDHMVMMSKPNQLTSYLLQIAGKY